MKKFVSMLLLSCGLMSAQYRGNYRGHYEPRYRSYGYYNGNHGRADAWIGGAMVGGAVGILAYDAYRRRHEPVIVVNPAPTVIYVQPPVTETCKTVSIEGDKRTICKDSNGNWNILQ
jgi:hypothetical protein